VLETGRDAEALLLANLAQIDGSRAAMKFGLRNTYNAAILPSRTTMKSSRCTRAQLP